MNGRVGGVQKRLVSWVLLSLAWAIVASVMAPSARASGLVVTVYVVGADRIGVPGADAVVWLAEPPSGDPAASNGGRQITSRTKTFAPRVVVLPVGGEVRFPNDDPIFHNVFSTSEAASFDLGLYRNGEARLQRFVKAGVVPIYCNIHPQMLAYVVVVPSSSYALAGPEGVARISPVAVGHHALRVWHEKGGDWSGVVDVEADRDASLEVTLDASTWRVGAHLNKYGKPYPPPDDDEFRY